MWGFGFGSAWREDRGGMEIGIKNDVDDDQMKRERKP